MTQRKSKRCIELSRNLIGLLPKMRVSDWLLQPEAATVEPRFNKPLFNEVFDITNDILRPGQSYSEMYGIEPRYNEHNPDART